MRVAPILTFVVLAAGAAAGYAYWQQQAARVPPGLARANDRIEIERVDVATKYAGRLAEVLVNEGASVEKGEIVARIDTTGASGLALAIKPWRVDRQQHAHAPVVPPAARGGVWIRYAHEDAVWL